MEFIDGKYYCDECAIKELKKRNEELQAYVDITDDLRAQNLSLFESAESAEKKLADAAKRIDKLVWNYENMDYDEHSLLDGLRKLAKEMEK